MMVLNHIERIVEKTADCKMAPMVFKEIKPELTELAGLLNCSRHQALIFALIFYFTLENDDAGINQLADHLGISVVGMLKYKDDLNVLVKRRLVRHQQENHIFMKSRQHSYYVHYSVVDGLLKKKICLVDKSLKCNIDFIVNLMEMVESAGDDNMDNKMIEADFEQLCSENKHLRIAEGLLRSNGFSACEKILLVFVAGKLMEGEEETDITEALGYLDANKSVQLSLRRDLISGRNQLIRRKLLALAPGMFRSQSVTITDKGLEFLLGDEAVAFSLKTAKTKAEISPENIAAVTMFLNPGEQEQIETLRQLLTAEKFSSISSRMKQQNMKAGFTILFHGAPGTGKTESLFQLARKTGRSIMPVDISCTKSSWFGESEKLIKGIFDQYRTLAQKQALCPILLFNEADGIFGRRSTKMDSSVSQTLNAMQNIILQEMEDFEGILAATTNLCENLDTAFDRRFLYKIRFEVPGLTARQQILGAKLPFLEPPAISRLCERYLLTGGQMANIAKKCQIHQVLNGLWPGPDELDRLCDAELGLQQKAKLGF